MTDKPYATGGIPDNDHFNDALQKIIPHKPSDIIAHLIAELQPEAVAVTARRSRQFSSKNPQIYLLLRGAVHLHRQSDDLLMTTIYAPHIIGLAELLHPVGKTYLHLDRDCEIHVVAGGKVLQKLDQQPMLWADVSRILAYQLHFASLRDLHLLNNHAYDAIRGKLLELINAPENTRLEYSALRYIQERTTLARSTILKCLGDLKTGGYIAMEKGHLTQVFNLPQRY
ncbi:helix-turn-helix domain-containing protein [Serratia quinivorans]|uniref:helix-turn-helix domain-containing protein n=1 Tax=Serratia quinivorans TaxID=137545 RepID=UPI003F9BEE0D